MKNIVIIVAIVITALTSGCRRSDLREHVFLVPGMTSSNTNTIKQAIFFYEGVVKDSLVFDLQNKTLKVKFDSMKVAQTNIRMAIEGNNIKVEYPAKTNKIAGYLNDRDTEIK